MSMQLLEILLWNTEGELRTPLVFKPGTMNIITGGSSTGKSALIDIVDYCMAADECRVPGVIRRTVAWYGLRLSIGTQELLIVRRGPAPGHKSSQEVYFQEGMHLEMPTFTELRGNTNLAALEELLTRKVGISPNLNTPPDSSTRGELEATVRHALKFCFQPQYEIASRNILFHRQGEPFMAQALIDTLPYFLGAVREDYLSKHDELRRGRRQLKRLERSLREEESMGGGGMERGLALLAEAQDVGLSPHTEPPATAAELRGRLAGAREWRPDLPPARAGDVIPSLQAEINALELKRLRLRDEIRAIESFSHHLQGFSEEASEQKVRLESVGLFDADDANPTCPLCQQDIEGVLPSVTEIRQSFEEIDSTLRAYGSDRPNLESHLVEHQEALQVVEAHLRERRRAVSELRARDAEAVRRFDPIAAQAFVAGRVQLYLDSTDSVRVDSDLKSEIAKLQSRVKELEADLDENGLESRVRSKLAQASQPMQRWAQELDVEYKRSPLRLDWRKLTLVASTDDGELPLSQMGSGKNWVGYHLLAHFALHTLFVTKRRPVPGFLFLDQPTQVFYPPDQDAQGRLDNLRDEDREAVHAMFKWIYNRCGELGSSFQVIITDHADLRQPFFRQAVVERWRDGKKLIPDNWIK